MLSSYNEPKEIFKIPQTKSQPRNHLFPLLGKFPKLPDRINEEFEKVEESLATLHLDRV